jgi:hypothetical protein
MKTYLTTGAILDWLSRRHARLAERLAACRARDGHRRAAWLLERMARQQETLAEALDRFAAGAAEEIREAYFQFVPEEDEAAAALETLPLRQDLEDPEAVELFMTQSRRMEALYRRLADLAEFEAVKEAFSDMARQIHGRREKAAESLGHDQSI